MAQQFSKFTWSDAYSRLGRLALAAAIAVFLVIVAGGIVRVTGSGGACPDWPTCFGQWTPPAGLSAPVEYIHRLVSVLAGVLTLAAAWYAVRRFRPEPMLTWPLYLSLAAVLLQVGLGALLALGVVAEGRAWTSAVHLALSLFILGAITFVSVVALVRARQQSEGDQPAMPLTYRSPFAVLSLAVLAVFFVLLVSGALVAGMQAGAACAAWPLCGTQLWPENAAGWISLFHRFVVAAAGILLAVQFFLAWRTQRSQAPILVTTAAAASLFLAQALMGARLVQGFPVSMLALHLATATAVWAALAAQVTLVGLAGRTAEQERLEAQELAGRRAMWRDLLLLTKPVVVLLLLVTTYAGMVIGARALPPFWLTFWTMLGGFMAAGGSSAINQYIDRFDDGKMQRTQKRPIPAGRLTPGEGLAFGVVLALLAFYVLAAFVNMLAALLSLAGTIYYVLLYSIFLKKTTVQNIVIGGGAGSIPPLVGWAAATGGLNVPSLFLFAIVFMWTPPHFWALALVRRKDYARAGVPMLPVIRGEKETGWQIFIYTLELVALTLLLPLFGLGGALYLVGAALLGAWLIFSAWKVWKLGGNKTAWKMYRYSSMYLFFLFVALMVDRLLL
jgi:protoheme IX farnesyltransferase